MLNGKLWDILHCMIVVTFAINGLDYLNHHYSNTMLNIGIMMVSSFVLGVVLYIIQTKLQSKLQKKRQ